jgi:hypothetical protein
MPAYAARTSEAGGDGSAPCSDAGAAMQQDLKQIVEFSNYWLSKTRAGRLPAFSDLLPEEIFRSLPNLVVWEVIDGGEDFRCRLCGEDLNRNYGWNPKGELLSDVIMENPSVAVFGDNFRHCLSLGAPVTVIDTFRGHLGTAKRTAGIIAPLAGPEAAIGELICCSIYLENGSHEEADRQLSALFHRIENTN